MRNENLFYSVDHNILPTPLSFHRDNISKKQKQNLITKQDDGMQSYL
jgi:hypothetical protein